MKGIKFFTILITIALTFVSCSDFLEKEYDASLSEEKVFANQTLTREFLTNIYTNLPDGFAGYSDDQFLGASRDCMTDNATSFWGLHYFNKINSDAYTAADHPLLGFWNTDFAGIRKANVFLKNAKENVVGNSSIGGDDNRLFDRYRAEAQLLRAIFHFDLVCWFGNTPILGEDADGIPIVLDMNNQEQMNMARQPAADVLEWVAAQCDEVKDKLPFRYANEDVNWGRMNGAAAYALKTRALLYRASALNNPTNDVQHWQKAAQAAIDFINKNKTESRPYALYNDYQKIFTDNPTYSNEIILSRSVWNTNTIDRQLLPFGYSGSIAGSGRTNPTQNFIDAFEMKNGKRIDENGSTYDPGNPYANRDPRLEAIVFHHNSIWGRADYGEQRPIDVSTPDGADYRGSMGGTYTGYYLKKFVNPDLIMKAPANMPHSWIIFRYAEILLNAAEALNEAGQTTEAMKYVNEVRDRTGVKMPSYTGLDQEKLRVRIRNERRIELSFEDHRFFDLRRWRAYDGVTAESERTKPRYEQLLNMYGIMVINSVYVYTGAPGTPESNNDMDLRVFNNPKNYYFPVPDAEVKRAPKLGQNTGWENN